MPSPKSSVPSPGRSRRADGERSRRAILEAAARLATTRGLDGLSIGDLADHIGMSKSGLYAHFGSKEELELATIDIALEIFQADVMGPAMGAAPGLARLWALTDGFLSHVERRVFPGGCFFAAVATELDTRPGKPRERVCEVQKTWMQILEHCLEDARAAGEIHPKADAVQIAFEIEAMLLAANFAFVMSGDAVMLGRARRGVEGVLERAAASPRLRRTTGHSRSAR